MKPEHTKHPFQVIRGQNLFESVYRLTKTASAPTPRACVFISHKKEDKDEAKKVAEALQDRGVDVYFDENDTILTHARDRGDEEAMVKCIELGLDNCTHLLGIITPLSKNSWWIPYEIGGATGRRRECAHLVDKRVTDLPSYIKVAPLLLDQEALEQWVSHLEKRQFLTLENLQKKAAATASLQEFLPRRRSLSEIHFT